jgi:Mn2+/Fe2+ NRAMP family transporter
MNSGSSNNADEPLVLSARREEPRGCLASAKQALRTFGPGLMVCLADTDGACLVTAAQSGAEERYKLLMLQIVLIPVLYIAQELTIRLALYRQQGLVGCVRSSFGKIPALLIAVPLIISCVAAFVTEVANIASAMKILGVNPSLTAAVTCLFMLALALSGSYSNAEKIGLTVGSLQVVFFILMFAAKPSLSEILEDSVQFPITDGEFGNLVTANIGAVIMPWMLAYQQSACALERNSVEELQDRRFETKIGSFITQGVMSAVLIMGAAVPGTRSINNVEDLAALCRTICGNAALGNAITLFAVIGACIVAAIVVMLCGAWVIEDVAKLEQAPLDGDAIAAAGDIRPGSEDSIIERVKARPSYFFGIILTVSAALAVVAIGGNDNTGVLDVATQILNGILMIPIVGVLWYLTAFHLPECPLVGVRKWVTGISFFVCCVFSVVGLLTQGGSSRM